ncbi:MAG: hypothetical protein ABW168_13855 [Sedimenticola sp.]
MSESGVPLIQNGVATFYGVGERNLATVPTIISTFDEAKSEILNGCISIAYGKRIYGKTMSFGGHLGSIEIRQNIQM